MAMKNTQEVPLRSFNVLPDEYHVPEPVSSFFIETFERLDSAAQATFPHRHDFYEILYLTGGEGTHIIDFEPYPVVPLKL